MLKELIEAKILLLKEHCFGDRPGPAIRAYTRRPGVSDSVGIGVGSDGTLLATSDGLSPNSQASSSSASVSAALPPLKRKIAYSTSPSPGGPEQDAVNGGGFTQSEFGQFGITTADDCDAGVDGAVARSGGVAAGSGSGTIGGREAAWGHEETSQTSTPAYPVERCIVWSRVGAVADRQLLLRGISAVVVDCGLAAATPTMSPFSL